MVATITIFQNLIFNQCNRFKECKEREIQRKEIDFYRGTSLPNNLIIVISVKLKGKFETKRKNRKKQNELIEKKIKLNQVKLKLVVVLLKI